jgi:hypothetical protein
MQRLLSLVLIAAASTMLLACGGDEGESNTETSTTSTEAESEFTPEQQIEAAIVVWYGADKQAACGILSDAALDSIGGIDKCLGNAADPVGTKVEVTDIVVDGETATAQAEPKGATAVVPFELVLVDGQWLVENPVPIIF